jgi:hypothetical protein
MKKTIAAVWALASALLLPLPADAASISQAKVVGVFVNGSRSDSFGDYVELQIRFDKSFGTSCFSDNFSAIYRVYQGSAKRDVDQIALEGFRHAAISAMLSGIKVTALTNGCHATFHLLASLNVAP